MNQRDTETALILAGVAIAIYILYRHSLSQAVTLPGSGDAGAPVTATNTAPMTITGTAAAAAPTFATTAPATGIGAVLENAFNQVFPMQISDAGAAFIKQEEGLRLTSYPDANGYSIGYGHFITSNDMVNYGLPAEAGVVISQALADQLFADDILRVEYVINQDVSAVLSQNQFDALCSFVYNVGSTAFWNSTLLADLNAGNYAGAAAEFQRWNKSLGTVSTALTTRRLAEASLFETA
jgi:lysozyme